jgi:hypothetical protein
VLAAVRSPPFLTMSVEHNVKEKVCKLHEPVGAFIALRQFNEELKQDKCR